MVGASIESRRALIGLVSYLTLATFVHALHAEDSTEGYCSPIINGVASGANVTIECNLTREEAISVSSESFEEAYWALSRLTGQQTNYLLPLLHAFSQDPSQEKWDAVQVEVSEIANLVTHAREALFVFESTLPIDRKNDFQRIHGLLSSRRIALLYFFENEAAEFEASDLPEGLEAIDEWISSYQKLMIDLEQEMSKVVEAIKTISS